MAGLALLSIFTIYRNSTGSRNSKPLWCFGESVQLSVMLSSLLFLYGIWYVVLLLSYVTHWHSSSLFQRKHRTGFHTTDVILDSIIRRKCYAPLLLWVHAWVHVVTVQTGLITTIWATADLVSYLVTVSMSPIFSFQFNLTDLVTLAYWVVSIPCPIISDTEIQWIKRRHLVFNFALAKLYTNSLMSTLNARPTHRDIGYDSTGVSERKTKSVDTARRVSDWPKLTSRGVYSHCGIVAGCCHSTKTGGTRFVKTVTCLNLHDSINRCLFTLSPMKWWIFRTNPTSNGQQTLATTPPLPITRESRLTQCLFYNRTITSDRNVSIWPYISLTCPPSSSLVLNVYYALRIIQIMHTWLQSALKYLLSVMVT